MIVSLIVAKAKNNAIGKDNNLLWHFPADMKFFRETTTGHCIITGRKNYESIPDKFRPLVNRTNIVVTRNPEFNEQAIIVCHSIEEAIKKAKELGETEVFIIGGGQIYKEALTKGLIDKMYITHVHQNFDGDTFFPEKTNEWKKISETNHPKDEKHRYSYSFAVYEKMN